MRILSVHNYYLQPGGEDSVFRAEATLLRQHGHEVIEYVDDNRRIAGASKAATALQTIWSPASYAKIRSSIREHRPDLVHFHNTFPLISPSAYYACQAANLPVVQTLDNQRLICPAASFYRNGNLCLDCFGKTPPWPGIVHACYHDSRLQTAVVAAMLMFHRLIRTWQRRVDVYLASTNFYRDLFIKAGLPADKVLVKPHFVWPPGEPSLSKSSGDYALFVGRLDPEKGIRTLLRAWKTLDIPLKIRGGGRLKSEVQDFISANPEKPVELVGPLSETELSRLMREARFLVLPSEGYYETFGLVAVECYARGVPVLASRIGVMQEIILDGKTGLHFNPGDAQDLADKALWLWNHPLELRAMSAEALVEYERKFTPEPNYGMLMNIYEKALKARTL